MAADDQQAHDSLPKIAHPSVDKETIGAKAVESLNGLLADIFSLYIKTKNFHWHMTGPNFRDYHLLLDEHAEQLFAITDDIAERVRKLGAPTITSIGHITRLQSIRDSDERRLKPAAMLSQLHQDEMILLESMIVSHKLCESANDVATTSLLKNWIDQSQRRAWFLAEILDGS